LAWGIIFQGRALTEQGQREEGVARLHQGLAAWQASGAQVFRPYCLALLAAAYGKGGQVEEGLNTLAEALTLVDNTEERWYEAELYRLKGELTLQGANQKKSCRVGNAHQSVSNAEAVTVGCAHSTEESKAEACFQKAIEVARRQSAKSLELRAVMSLARLWQQQGKQREAHVLLSEIYNWFTEGFDTKDLQEARALIEELSRREIEPVKN
jgi:predicted ATPase